jgi:hypothetical protein
MFRKGYIPTPEHRAKLSEAAKRRSAEGRGQVQTLALRAKRSANGKRQWAEGRSSIAQLHTSEAEAKCAEANRQSPRRKTQLAYILKLKRVRYRPRFSSTLFDERKVAELILRWQRTGDGELFATIIAISLPLINYLIYKYSYQSRSDFCETRSEVILKLAKALPKFDPTRGRAFTLYFYAIKRFLFSRFEKEVRRRSREVSTDPEIMAETVGNWNSASDNWSDGFANWNEPPRRASEEFLERLRDLLRPSADWQWRWRWQPKGTLLMSEWKSEWTWQHLGKIAV